MKKTNKTYEAACYYMDNLGKIKGLKTFDVADQFGVDREALKEEIYKVRLFRSIDR